MTGLLALSSRFLLFQFDVSLFLFVLTMIKFQSATVWKMAHTVAVVECLDVKRLRYNRLWAQSLKYTLISKDITFIKERSNHQGKEPLLEYKIQLMSQGNSIPD